MSTVQLQVEDSKLELLLGKLKNLVDEGLVIDISTQNSDGIQLSFREAQNRVSKAVKDYKKNSELFKELDKDFFEETEKRLIKRYNNENSKAS